MIAESHKALLHPVTAGPGPALDAVLVPAARPVGHLRTAMGLATQLGAELVMLCSREACSTNVETLASEWPALRWAAVDLPTGYTHELLRFETSGVGLARAGRLGDLSVKRNLGLLLARLTGWRTIMFLDDDLRAIDPDDVRTAAAGLGRLAVTGLRVAEFPDNSVVCHANRLAGYRQDVFVSGSALLVDCEHQLRFFPETYNEDWLFYADALAAGSVGMAGSAQQLRYRPFADRRRAESEEFGDVLAEGLFSVLHEGVAPETTRRPAHWRRFLGDRRAFIDRIVRRLEARPELADGPAALAALRAADRRLGELTPATFTEYLRAWRNDRATWTTRLADLRPVGDLGLALNFLDLDHVAVVSGNVCPSAVRARRATPLSIAMGQVVAPSPNVPAWVVVEDGAEIAPTAQVGVPYRPLLEGEWDKLGRSTVIGPDSRIGDFCVVGEEARLGTGCVLDAHTMVGGGVTLGDRVLLTHRASVDPKAVIGDDCVIGGLVAERSKVGDRCRVFGSLVHRQLDPASPWDADESVEGSPILEEGAFVGWAATVVGSVRIGVGAYVCAGAIVTRDVPDGHIVSGVNTIRPPSEWNGTLGKSEFFRPAPPETSPPPLLPSAPLAIKYVVDEPARRTGVLGRVRRLVAQLQPRRLSQ